MKSKYTMYAQLVLTQLLWAGVFIAGQMAVYEVSPIMTALARNVVASLVLVFILWLSNGKKLCFPDKKNWLLVFVTGFFGVSLYSILVFFGLTYTTAISASLLIPTTQPIITMLLSSRIYKEKISVSHYLGLLLGILGIAGILTNTWALKTLHHEFIGNLLMLAAASSYSAYSVCSRAMVTKMPVLECVTYSTLGGTVCLIPLACMYEDFNVMFSAGSNFWISIIYMAFLSSVLPTIWWNEGIKRLGPSRVGLLTLLMPLFALGMAYFLLHQSPTMLQIGGGILSLFGVALAVGLLQLRRSSKGERYEGYEKNL